LIAADDQLPARCRARRGRQPPLMSEQEGTAAFEAEMDARLGSFVKRAEQALIAAKTAALADYGLTVPQYAAMLMLAHIPEASAAQLSRACAVTPQTMAIVVENLEAKGYVSREPSPLHRRVLAVRLTEAGHDILRLADPAARAVEKRLSDAFSAAEASQLRSLLTRAAQALTVEKESA
jgi:DNA-binding MarR family transcriptional regulator